MALLDVLNEDGTPTGDTKTKAEIHEQGLWHRSAHVWIYSSKGDVLLQLRAKDKDSSPGLWDISAAGHVDAGETPAMSAVREIQEEVGLEINEELLKPIWERRQSTYSSDNGWQNNQISSEFILLFDGDKDYLVFQEDEVDALEWKNIDVLKNELFDPNIKTKYVPHGDEYYKRILSEIEKALISV